MTVPPTRSGRLAVPSGRGSGAPHAALLIDFDNVTLGIRSDLTKELRTLLNSEIIRGKVAVQRAYADWRRYPQYIVPLSESSIDLIFAPAFGTNKKNATDIRLAVDAIELVFTRPEIGTIILLSGDSDFSSLVLKLKEYGKYIIGVGIRESASDLLIQNCDEYYSYNDLAGLTKEVDPPSIQRDPWELVVEAAQQMVRNRDVMRSDRLKQVMQQIDPNFDERNAGFNRFSKFVTEAASRGLIRVTKLDNGQYEVAAEGQSPTPETEAAASSTTTRRRSGRGRRPRGRSATPSEPEKAKDEAKPARRQRAPSTAARSDELTLAAAFTLLGKALKGQAAPISETLLREAMVALHGSEDALLSEERFGRFLRQANDAEVAEVRKSSDGSLEVAPSKSAALLARSQRAKTAPPPTSDPSPDTPEPAAETEKPVSSTAVRGAGIGFRRGSRMGARRASDLPLVGVVTADGAPASAPAGEAKATKKKRPTRKKAAPAKAKARAGSKPAPKGKSTEAGLEDAGAAKKGTRKRARPSRAKTKASGSVTGDAAGSRSESKTPVAKKATKRPRKRAKKKAPPKPA